MSACEVCGVRTLKTREPLARACSGCGKSLCNAHTHYYVDGQNVAITRAAPPQCATCSGMVTIHCFFGQCPQIVEHRDPMQGSRIMQEHYDRKHAADLTDLGYPTEPKIHYADGLLPDIDGYVHGIVASDPVWIVQCDGCGRVAVGDVDSHGKRSNMVIQFCGIEFGGPAVDPRRLCGRCRVDSDWEDFETRQLRARPADLAVGEQYMRDSAPERAFAEIVLPAAASRGRQLSAWWASRALGGHLSDEDREMALAAYSRSFDVQMGTTKGPKGGVRPGFPNEDGGDFLRKAEARRREADADAAAAATIDEGALFRMEEFA